MDFEQVPHKLWCEENDKTMRVMIKVGDNKPFALFQVAKSIVQNANMATVFAWGGGDTSDAATHTIAPSS